MSNAIKAVEVSDNGKTGPVSVTHANQYTCPKDCPLMRSGCYAESGAQGVYVTSKVNKAARENPLPVEEYAYQEAIAIAGLSGERPLRIHVVGDATTDECARLLANAAEYHTNKHGQPVWTYTHAWRGVARASWGAVSVLASCETPEDVKFAMERGYGAAIVVERHSGDKAYVQDGVKLIPCPQQTGRAENCVECGLCMRADSMLSQRSVIAFEVHGQQSKAAQAKLVQIQLGE